MAQNPILGLLASQELGTVKIILNILYCTLHGWIKGAKCAFIFHEVATVLHGKQSTAIMKSMLLTCYCFCSIANSRK